MPSGKLAARQLNWWRMIYNAAASVIIYGEDCTARDHARTPSRYTCTEVCALAACCPLAGVLITRSSHRSAGDGMGRSASLHLPELITPNLSAPSLRSSYSFTVKTPHFRFSWGHKEKKEKNGLGPKKLLLPKLWNNSLDIIWNLAESFNAFAEWLALDISPDSDWS